MRAAGSEREGSLGIRLSMILRLADVNGVHSCSPFPRQFLGRNSKAGWATRAAYVLSLRRRAGSNYGNGRFDLLIPSDFASYYSRHKSLAPTRSSHIQVSAKPLANGAIRPRGCAKTRQPNCFHQTGDLRHRCMRYPRLTFAQRCSRRSGLWRFPTLP
jgi:hypothetical protein